MESQNEIKNVLLETGHCFKVANNLTELCSGPSVLWKIKPVTMKFAVEMKLFLRDELEVCIVFFSLLIGKQNKKVT